MWKRAWRGDYADRGNSDRRSRAIQDVEVSAPEEQTEISEEVVTQDVEDAPVITRRKKKKKYKRKLRGGEKKPQASDELQQALSSLFQSKRIHSRVIQKMKALRVTKVGV